MPIRSLVFLGSLALCVPGCGGDNRVPIHGTVTYNGAPLASGTIQFFSKDNPNVTEAGLISAGAYALPQGKGLPPGNYRVEISAAANPTAARAPDAAPGTPHRFKELLRNEYNTKSTLAIEVTPASTGEFNFTTK